jgi:hypothetical protein
VIVLDRKSFPEPKIGDRDRSSSSAAFQAQAFYSQCMSARRGAADFYVDCMQITFGVVIIRRGIPSPNLHPIK